MPRKPGNTSSFARLLAAILTGAALAVISGCGASDETFTSGEADRALAALDAVQQYVEEGRCEKARTYINRLAVQSTHVNDDRPELGEAWASSVAQLNRLVVRECVEITPEGPTPEVTPETGPTDNGGGTEPTEPAGGNTDNGGGGNLPDGGNTDNGTDQGGQGGGGNNTPPPDNSGGAGPGT